MEKEADVMTAIINEPDETESRKEIASIVGTFKSSFHRDQYWDIYAFNSSIRGLQLTLSTHIKALEIFK